MPPRLDDRYIYLGLSVFFLAAAYGIRYAITDIVNLTRIGPIEAPPSDKKDEQPEDSITLETLHTLATSPNPSIAASATSLIIQRFVQLPNASQLLSQDASSKNPNLRRQARTAMEFLRDWRSASAFRDAAGAMLQTPVLSPRLRGMGVGGSSGEVMVTPESLPDLIEVGGSGSWAGSRVELGEGEEVVVPSARSPVAGWMNVPRERPPGSADLAEQERRRWRREAMVLHEGGGTVNEDDIFRPR